MRRSPAGCRRWLVLASILAVSVAVPGVAQAVDEPVVLDQTYGPVLKGVELWLMLRAQDTPWYSTATVTFAVATPPSHGTLGTPGDAQCGVLGQLRTCDAMIVYTPDAVNPGADSFTYTASDGTSTSAPATMTLDIVDDTTPPVGTVRVDDLDSFFGYANSLDVVLGVDASDDLSPVSRVRISNAPTTASGLLTAALEIDFPGATHVQWNLGGHGGSTANGKHTVYVQWRDGAGNWSGVSSASIVLDRTVPTASGLAQSITKGPLGYGDSVPVRFTWKGSGRGAELRSYEFELAVDGGGFRDTAFGKATFIKRGLPAGHRYRARVRAVDPAANASPWLVTPWFTAQRVRQSAGAIDYRGSWGLVTYVPEGTVLRYSFSAGSTASLTFTGRSVAWVAATGPDDGRATVLIDGRVARSVDLHTSRIQLGRVVFSASWPRSGKHRIMLQVTDPRATVQELLILK